MRANDFGPADFGNMQDLAQRIAATRDPGGNIEFTGEWREFIHGIRDLDQTVRGSPTKISTRTIGSGPNLRAFRRFAQDPTTVPDRGTFAGRYFTTAGDAGRALVATGLMDSTDPEDVLGYFRRVAVATGAAIPAGPNSGLFRGDSGNRHNELDATPEDGSLLDPTWTPWILAVGCILIIALVIMLVKS